MLRPAKRAPSIARRYRFLSHTADVGIVATGGSLEEAFASAAQGLFAFIADLRRVRERGERRIVVQASDVGGLLVGFLNEANFTYETEHFLFRRFTVLELVPHERLVAVGYGEPVDVARHRVRAVVKAATFHLLAISRRRGGWRVQVLLDI